MSRLWLKLFRDLRAYRVQAIGIAVVVMLGISMYHSFYLSYRSMGESYEWGYDELRLADFTVEFQVAPEQAVTRLATIPGVRSIAGRIKRDVRVEQSPGRRKIVTGRIISIPDVGEPPINRLVLLEGDYLGPATGREVLLERGFAEAHGYSPGDAIYPVVDGVRRAFRVTGIVSSIEYLYVVRSKENLFPTPESFGVMWMRRQQAERLFGMHGQVNEIVALTDPQARERVMSAMYADLRRYGATPPIPQEQQPSRQLLDQDLAGLGQFAVMFPSLFIGAAALSVFAILARTVERERRQIGFLRASGLSAGRVGLQYLALAGLMGMVGAIPGVLLGQWFALGITQMYLDQLGIPFLRLASGVSVGLLGVAITLTTSLIAGWGPAIGAARMSPADAMRAGAGGGAQRIPPRLLARLQRGTSFITRVALSNLFRHLQRTAYTVFGVVAGLVMMIMTMAMLDALEYSIDYYFNDVRNYDVDVGFGAPVSETVVDQVRAWPEVEWAEGNVGLPVKISHGDTTDDLVITGVPRGSRLQRFEDADGNPVPLVGDGIYPVGATARSLGLERGDLLRVEYAYNSREVRLIRPVRVTRTLRQPIGSGLYMNADTLRQQMGRIVGFPPGTIGGMVIKARPGYEQAVAARAYDLPGAIMAETTFDIRAEMDQSMAITYAFIGILMLFAGALTVAIVYNTINTNVHERRSEIASLRALGVRMSEITHMVTVENLISAVMGVVIGTPLGVAGARWMMSMWETETFSLDFHVYPRTFAITIAFSLLLVVICQLPALRSLAGMNLAQMTRLHGE
ncbi:MAG: ABC transporter permease [candidate division WS1 bacterium]|jgi:putative ABC transport system permease protein|nr:ABC transporter permease [candidate division WS1 bacterium]